MSAFVKDYSIKDNRNSILPWRYFDPSNFLISIKATKHSKRWGGVGWGGRGGGGGGGGGVGRGGGGQKEQSGMIEGRG